MEEDEVDDADADPANEIQTLDLSGFDLTLSDGGGTVAIPSIWETSGANIFYNAGKVGVGKDPGVDRRQFQVNAQDDQAVAAINNSANYGAIYATNSGGGPAADFRNSIRILDGSQGAGKILTSDASGHTSWEEPIWSKNGTSAYYDGGSVGIGTLNPTRLLDLHGGTTHSWMGFHTNSSGNSTTDGLLLGINSSSLEAFIWNYENTSLFFGTNASLRMTIQADGDVGIGTETPDQRLTVFGNASKSSGGTSWAVFSDRRLKDLHGNYEKGLTEIMALQPVAFNYKVGNPLDLPSDNEEVGLIAQEVREIFPEAVSESRNGYLDFNMHYINVAFINAIKELKSENDILKTDNSFLKDKVTELESRLAEIEKILQP